MSSIRSAGPTVRNAIRSTRNSAGRNYQRRNYHEEINNKHSGSNKNPSGEIPWMLGAAAFAVPAGVWLTARTTGHERNNLGEVAVGPAAERLKETYHYNYEHPGQRIGEFVENGKDAFSHMTGTPRRGPDNDIRNEPTRLRREAEERAGGTLKSAEDKTKSFFGSFGRAKDDSLDYVKDRASEAEQKLYDAFNKPQVPRKGNYTFEPSKEEHTEESGTFPGTNIPHVKPHGDYRGERGRSTSKNFEDAVEGPPVDSPNKAPTVPSSDEKMITKAHHRRLYAKDAANMYPEKSKKGEGVLDTARLTEPVNSWTRPLRGNASKDAPPKHD